jgi:hypothetical protein
MSFRYETVEEFAAQTERLVAEHPTRVMRLLSFPRFDSARGNRLNETLLCCRCGW